MIVPGPLRSFGGMTIRRVATLAMLTACESASDPHSEQPQTGSGAAGPPRPAVIAAEEGELRFLRGGTAPLIIKVDPVTTGSRRMVLGSSDLPPGDAIGAHRHLEEDEIILILSGTARVRLADRHYPAGAGGTVFIPHGTCIELANVGADTLRTVFVFSSPGFEQALREVSSLPGESPRRVMPGERAAAFHKGHAETDC